MNKDLAQRNFQRIIPLCFVMFISLLSGAQSPMLQWVQQFGNTPDENTSGSYVIVDSNRAVITAGTFLNSVDFDKGPGVAALTSAGSEDIFIAKHDTAGNFIWVKRIGGNWSDRIRDIKFDQEGNLMILGMFQGIVDLDPGPGVQQFISNGANCFLLKLDNDGNFMWVRTFLLNDMNCLETDRQNAIIIGGDFAGTVDFDPGSGIFNMTAGNFYDDLFVLKLDANGNFLWARQMPNQGVAELQEFGIESDAQNNILFAGCFTSSMDFDPGPASFNMVSAGAADVFLLKLDAAGNFQWAKRWGGTGSDKALGLEVDDAGFIYTTGHYYFTVDFDPGPGIFNLNAVVYGAFISKLDPAGNFIFALAPSGGESIGQDIKLDSSGNIYVSGNFDGDVDFDPGPSTYLVTGGHLFVLKLDNSGNFKWVSPFQTQTNVFFQSIYNAIAVDIYKNVYHTGSFPTTVDFDPQSGAALLTPVGSWDMYLLKLRQCATATHLSADFCSSYTWNGQTYTNGGTHYQVFPISPDCDSVVSLTLRKLDPFTDLQVSACNQYIWNGQLFTNSGVYRDTFPLISGCDSIVQLNLTVHTPSFSGLQQTVCGSFSWNGQTYYLSGLYRDTFMNANGCDSIVEMNLTITPFPQPELGQDTIVCLGNSIQLYPGNFDAYLWSDGSNGSSLSVSASGVFWVEVTEDGCIARDTILVDGEVCNECFLTADTKIYPAPFRSWLTIDKNWTMCEVRLDLYNALGQLVMKDKPVFNGKNEYYLDHLAAGIYFYVLKGKGARIGSGSILKQ